MFDYDLPSDLIAQRPTTSRTESRLLVLNRTSGTIAHRSFSDLPEYLRAGDVLVLNDTRVIPARVPARKLNTGGKVELLLLEETEPGVWDALLRASRRPRPGTWLVLGEDAARAEILADGERGRVRLRMLSPRPFPAVLEEIGQPPLPPYIHRDAGAPDEFQDRSRYQTVYARRPGAVAAPTAGLHFTTELLDGIAQQGIGTATVTLHVGIGTFRPVTAEQVQEHVMEPERYTVSAEAVGDINRARSRGGRVVAVGSTSVRTLETVADSRGVLWPGQGRSGLFIYPPYPFRAVDAIITNFHLPKSTLIMMICAFAGRESVLQAYREAIREHYRFYSYGDAMLII